MSARSRRGPGFVSFRVQRAVTAWSEEFGKGEDAMCLSLRRIIPVTLAAAVLTFVVIAGVSEVVAEGFLKEIQVDSAPPPRSIAASLAFRPACQYDSEEIQYLRRA